MSPAVRARANPGPGRADRVRSSAAIRETPLPRSGDVILVNRQASVQFAEPMLFRVIRVHDWPTYTGWVWLDGYQLDETGDAVERRSIFVQADGLRRVPPPTSRPRPSRRPPTRAAGVPK